MIGKTDWLGIDSPSKLSIAGASSSVGGKS
jgi:hypothetical protein